MIILTSYKGKKVGVFGLGKAGEATVAALLASGAEIFAWDDKCKLGEGAAYLQPFSAWPWDELECLILGPGVPLTHPEPHAVVRAAQAANCPIIGDIELLAEACPDATIIGITGTNGKSTTTTLIAHILNAAGKNIQVGGNLGTPVLALEPLKKDGIYVIETSSYQLDLLQTIRFNIAVWLNITPDHIDRHGTLAGYIAAKEHIFERQQKSDVAVVGVDDEHSAKIVAKIRAKKEQKIVTLSVVKSDAEVVAKNGVLSAEDEQFDLRDIATLTGAHNWQNAAAAYAACRAVGVSADVIYEAMKTFPGLAHRLELIAEIRGVRFINDSKATNADATSKALAPYQNIYWILGGKAKAGGIESLTAFFSHIAHAFLIGEAANDFAKTLEGKVAYTQCGALDVATQKAAERAFAEGKAGAVVLLSPACASFDQFKNFEERGDAFRGVVENLLREQKVKNYAS